MTINEEDFIRPINTTNDALVMMGANLPNHTTSLQGFGRWVRVGSNAQATMTFRTRQSVYRAVSWLLAMAERAQLPKSSPDEDRRGPDASFVEILTAVFNEANADMDPLVEEFMSAWAVDDV